MLDEEKQKYINRIQELEERVEQLRLSRRVLMNLLEELDKERTMEISKIKIEQKRLRKSNFKYAFSLIQQNAKVLELERKLFT